MKVYLYRSGNGNDGNYPKLLVEIEGREGAALSALLANEYRPGPVRDWIVSNVIVDGCDQDSAVVFEGPNGETDMGAAWKTAELQEVTTEDREYYENERSMGVMLLRDILDPQAWEQYCRE